MIGLGRDLSDDLIEFIKSKKKGEILKRFSDEQIKEMINQNAPLKVVKSINLYKDEE
jgi:Mg/Co/Ni transporter MgtE